MEYRKISNLLHNTPNQPSKFRTKNWFEINDNSRGTYNTNSQIKFKTTMSKSSLCDYSDVYILLIVAITFTAQGAHTAAMQADRDNKQVILKNFALFTDCITEINNTKVDKGKDLDVVMSMYNLVEFSDNNSRATGSLWKYQKDEPEKPITNF